MTFLKLSDCSNISVESKFYAEISIKDRLLVVATVSEATFGHLNEKFWVKPPLRWLIRGKWRLSGFLSVIGLLKTQLFLIFIYLDYTDYCEQMP